MTNVNLAIDLADYDSMKETVFALVKTVQHQVKAIDELKKYLIQLSQELDEGESESEFEDQGTSEIPTERMSANLYIGVSISGLDVRQLLGSKQHTLH